MIIFNGDEAEFYEYLMKPETFLGFSPIANALKTEYLSGNDKR